MHLGSHSAGSADWGHSVAPHAPQNRKDAGDSAPQDGHDRSSLVASLRLMDRNNGPIPNSARVAGMFHEGAFISAGTFTRQYLAATDNGTGRNRGDQDPFVYQTSPQQ